MGTFVVDGKLVTCHRTQSGIESVLTGQIKLNARQRQFLLVVDKTDALNQKICAQLAEHVDIKSLIQSGLLEVQNEAAMKTDTSKKTVTHTEEQQQIVMAAVLHERAFAL